MTPIEIEHGQIRVNEVFQFVDTDQCKAWMIDFHSKRPAFAYASSDHSQEILFYAGEGTLMAADTPNPTIFRFPLKWDAWILIADGARYSYTIVAVRRQDGEIVWEDHGGE